MGCGASTKKRKSSSGEGPDLTGVMPGDNTTFTGDKRHKSLKQPADENLTPYELYLRKLRKYRVWFEQADKNSSNSLSVTELKQLFEQHNEKGYVMKWLAMYDDDCSGEISWGEFMEAMDKQEKVDISSSLKAEAEAERKRLYHRNKSWFSENIEDPGERKQLLISRPLTFRNLTELQGFQDSDAEMVVEDIWNDVEDEDRIAFKTLQPSLAAALKEKELAKNRSKYRKIVKKFAAEFKSMDTDGNGKLSKQEIRDGILNSKNYKQVEEAMAAVSKLLKADVSGDGSISMAEFVAYCEESHGVDDPSTTSTINTVFGGAYMRQYNDKLKQYRIYFLRADKDGNGVLSKKEVRKMLKILGSRTLGKSAASYLKKYDDDGDGQISWAEFLKSMDASTNMVRTQPQDDSPITKFLGKYYDLDKDPSKLKIKFYHVESYMSHVERIEDKKEATELATQVFMNLGERETLGASVTYSKLYMILLKRLRQVDAHRNRKQYMKQVSEFKKKFRKADLDGDGVISRAEFAEMLGNKKDCKGLEQAAAAAAKLVGKIDGDGSGSITWEEFQKYMSKRDAKKALKKKKSRAH